VVLQALAKDPDERPHSASAFSDALGRAMRGHPITPRNAPVVGPPVTQPVTSPVVVPAGTGALPQQPAAGRRPVGLWALAALLLAAAAAVGVLLLTKGSPEAVDHTPGGPVTTSSTTPTPTSGSTTSAPPSLIRVNEDDYLGEPADQAAASLRRLGLTVSTKPVTTDEYDPGTVANVSPTGNLHRGDEVTLSVAKAPPTTTAPTTTASSTPSATTSGSPTSTTTTEQTGTATSGGTEAADGPGQTSAGNG
jgi:serine/threonine-protein kinase